jgi:hypothetical protein
MAVYLIKDIIMKTLKKLAFIPMLALLVLPMWLTPVPASAEINLSDQLEDVGEATYGSTPSRGLTEIIGGLVQAALGLLGIILLILILYGGFLWMTAGGNTENVDKAKTIIKNAVAGLIIIMAAYAIAEFAVNAISTATT